MKTPLLAELLKPAEMVRRIVWWAFFAAIFGYVFVLSHMTAGAPAMPILWPFAYGLAVLSVGEAVTSFFISSILLPEPRLRQLLVDDPDPVVLASNPNTGTVDSTRLSKIKMLSPQDRRLLSIAPAFFGVYVVRLAFCESIALYGLVLGQVSRSFPIILPFAAASAGLMLTVSPSLDSSLERAEALLKSNANASVTAGTAATRPR